MHERNNEKERWWNGTGKGKSMYPEKNLYQWHVVHYKSHVKWSGIEPSSPVIRGRRLRKCEILDTHIGDYEDCHIPECDAV